MSLSPSAVGAASSPTQFDHEPWRWWRLWPVLLAPLAIASVYLFDALGWAAPLDKRVHETFAVAFLPVPLLVFAYRAARQRDPLMIWLTALTFCLWCREIHFAGTHRGIYVALALLAVWAFAWRERLVRSLARGLTRYWFAAAIFTYALSQLISRRAFKRVLPDEPRLHVPIEEIVETTAHVMLFVTALTGYWLFPRKPDDVSNRP